MDFFRHDYHSQWIRILLRNFSHPNRTILNSKKVRQTSTLVPLRHTPMTEIRRSRSDHRQYTPLGKRQYKRKLEPNAIRISFHSNIEFLESLPFILLARLPKTFLANLED